MISSLNKPKAISLLALSATLLVANACVSVNLSPSEGEKSKNVSYSVPGDSFRPVKSERADAAWIDNASGSTIAFQSSCGETADSSLESISEDLFAGFEHLKELRSERIAFDGREALARDVEAKVDGVTTRVQSIVYKKNRCSYVLTLVSLVKNLVADNSGKASTTRDMAAFERFTSSFKAP